MLCHLSCCVNALPQLLLQVIREGRPCHLYFDLECPAACNPGLDMDALVACLLHHVDEALGWVVVLAAVRDGHLVGCFRTKERGKTGGQGPEPEF